MIANTKNSDVRNAAGTGRMAKCVVFLVGSCAWVAPGFQGAGMLLINQSWNIISPNSSLGARNGLPIVTDYCLLNSLYQMDAKSHCIQLRLRNLVLVPLSTRLLPNVKDAI